MNALGLLTRAGFAGAELCPHPERLDSAAILVSGGRRGMVLCPECKETLQGVIAGFHARELGPAAVVAKVRALGYSRVDAARFLLQLTGDRLKVRAGLLGEADL